MSIMLRFTTSGRSSNRTLLIGGVTLAGLAFALPALAQDVLGGTLPSHAVPTQAAMPIAATQPVAATTTTTTTTTAPANPAGLPTGTATTTTTNLPGTLPPGLPPTTTGNTMLMPAGVPMGSGGSMGGMGSMGGGGDPLMQNAPMPQAVTDTVSRLQRTDPINLDDMIHAQDAINRLDLLLEIEKRQTELKKIRDERTKPPSMSAMSGMMGGLPSGMLNLPPVRTAAALGTPSEPPPPPRSSTYSLRRIYGAGGKYTAVLSVDDKPRSVQEGEELPDGSKVKTITLTAVTTEKNGKSKTLTIPSDSYIVRELGN